MRKVDAGTQVSMCLTPESRGNQQLIRNTRRGWSLEETHVEGRDCRVLNGGRGELLNRIFVLEPMAHPKVQLDLGSPPGSPVF